MVVVLWALIVLALAIWLVGFLIVHVAGPAIHLLLIIALILLVWNLVFSRRAA